jgi:D-alanyl-D-alanine carboxypeptidase (penicillin-binding protein 5/6)
LKTGHTTEAGFCMVSSAMQDSTRFLAVVMHTPTDDARQNDSQALLSDGFRFFQSAKIYNANDVITQQRAWKGEDKYLSLGVSKDFYVSIPRRAYPDLKVTLSITPNITAPIAAGQTLGSVNVYLKNKKIASAPLVALKADPKGGWWTRFTDAISHWFHNLFNKDKGSEVIIGKSTS